MDGLFMMRDQPNDAGAAQAAPRPIVRVFSLFLIHFLLIVFEIWCVAILLTFPSISDQTFAACSATKFDAVSGGPCLKILKGVLTMTDDPNKRQNDPSQSGGQREQQQQSRRQQGTDDSSQKRPAQGDNELEQDQEEQDQGEQRRAS